MAADSDFESDGEPNDDEEADEGGGEKHDARGDDHVEADPTAAPAPDVPAPAKFRGMYYRQCLGLAFRCESFCVYVCIYVMACNAMSCNVSVYIYTYIYVSHLRKVNA